MTVGDPPFYWYPNLPNYNYYPSLYTYTPPPCNHCYCLDYEPNNVTEFERKEKHLRCCKCLDIMAERLINGQSNDDNQQDRSESTETG